MDENELAKNVVLQFTTAMNDWEYKMYILSRIESNQSVSEEKIKIVGSNTRELLDKYYYEILSKFCTNKERKLGGHPTNYCKQTK